ncbi:MOSC domain-containing protein [Nostocoides sp. HKS02]|uniref:MOSC domain-containing protein n=1 Tax=Nostocoides sp. HKS02 TaxID=1813880 RepID=UPI0012B49C21|nr:MOSC domain-containing protein [Tetrasphaera sp. HKS02]QGN57379.1 hypothetical protein GKE56_05285 [Tetrasphaera sp. HKS02]
MAEVVELHIYPAHGEPGHTLSESMVEPDGLAGDRRKKAAVQVVAAQDVRPETRANVVVSMEPGELAASIGSVLRLGAVELDVTGAPSSCPGVYAAVRVPGTVHLGDPVTVAGPVTDGHTST